MDLGLCSKDYDIRFILESMQYLSQYFPVMPTWINIQSVMIVQPNGTILSQYRQISDHHRKKFKRNNHLQKDQQSSELQDKQNKAVDQYEVEKKMMKQKLSNISKSVIESSRKLFREAYENQLNKLIIDKTLIYYRAKYNILAIVVVRKFSIEIKEIQELICKVFNWYSEKCVSMNIEMNLPNVQIGRYERGQFKKLQWEIANQIDQKVSTSQIAKLPLLPRISKEQFIKEKFQDLGQVILNREQKLRKIQEKIQFHQNDSESSSKLSSPSKRSILNNFAQRVYPSAFSQKKSRTRKFKRQLSFMEKSVMVAKQMRIRLFLFYFCLIISLTLATMVYCGWFQDNEV